MPVEKFYKPRAASPSSADDFPLQYLPIDNKQPEENHDDSPKYHSNVNFQPSKSDKSIDFDVSAAYISDSVQKTFARKVERRKLFAEDFLSRLIQSSRLQIFTFITKW